MHSKDAVFKEVASEFQQFQGTIAKLSTKKQRIEYFELFPRIYGLGEFGKTRVPFTVMERIPGVGLSFKYSHLQLTLRKCIIASRLAKAAPTESLEEIPLTNLFISFVEFLQHFCHADIKPENMFLYHINNTPKLKIIDAVGINLDVTSLTFHPRKVMESVGDMICVCLVIAEIMTPDSHFGRSDNYLYEHSSLIYSSELAIRPLKKFLDQPLGQVTYKNLLKVLKTMTISIKIPKNIWAMCEA
jgi:hypothetical protein